MELSEKIKKNKEQLVLLETKKVNLERNIDNLRKKIENQELALSHSKSKED